MCSQHQHRLITFRLDQQSEEHARGQETGPFFVSQYDVINDLVTDAGLKSVEAAGEDHASDAVNICLENIGEMPVDSLDNQQVQDAAWQSGRS